MDAKSFLDSINKISPPHRPPIRAEVFGQKVFTDGSSKPALMTCSDNKQYVVKCVRQVPLHERVNFNEQVVAAIGAAMKAPIPSTEIVDVSDTLAEQISKMSTGAQKARPGLAHGSLYLAERNREGIKHCDLPANRPRFALLAVLYGLCQVDHDHQFMYLDDDLVWSFDHGHFFPRPKSESEVWTLKSLSECAKPAAIDDVIAGPCKFTPEELAPAISSLLGVTDDVIVKAVASPPAEWNISPEDRAALACHLASRRDILLGDKKPSKCPG